MTAKFDPIDKGAKYGSEHRFSVANAPGRKNSRREYANEMRRYGNLRPADLEAIRRDIDPCSLPAVHCSFVHIGERRLGLGARHIRGDPAADILGLYTRLPHSSEVESTTQCPCSSSPLCYTVPSETCKEVCSGRHSAIFCQVSTLANYFMSSFDDSFLLVVKHPAHDGTWLVRNIVRADIAHHFSLLIIMKISI